jgi:hypothetical protein
VRKTDFEYFTTFGVLEFTTKELLNLPEIERQFLLAASLITNDVRFHWSLMARSKTDGQNDDVKVMQLVRDFWSLRKLSAVVYEAQLALNRFVGQIDILKNMIAAGTLIIIKSANSGKYLELANQLRNKSAYHYGESELVKNIEGFDPDAKHTYYAHEQHGNSISALCEQIVTLPTIKNAFDGANENDFHAWCRSSSNSILHFCNLAIANICIERMPDKCIQIKQIVLGDEATLQDHRWPLCLVVETTEVKL